MLLGSLLKVLVAGSVLLPTAHADVTTHQSGEIEKKCVAEPNGNLYCDYGSYSLSYDKGKLICDTKRHGYPHYGGLNNLSYCDNDGYCYDKDGNRLIHCNAEGCLHCKGEVCDKPNNGGPDGGCDVNENGNFSCYYDDFELRYHEEELEYYGNGNIIYIQQMVPNLSRCDGYGCCSDDKGKCVTNCDSEGCSKCENEVCLEPKDENPEEPAIEFDNNFRNCEINCNYLDDNNVHCNLDCHLDDNSAESGKGDENGSGD